MLLYAYTRVVTPSTGWCQARLHQPAGPNPGQAPGHRAGLLPSSMGGDNVNFIIYYEVDDDNSKHALSITTFGENKEWVLLEKA